MITNSLIQRTEAARKRIQSFAFVIAVGAGVCFSVGFVISSVWGLRQSCGIELNEKVNPNDASMGSLMRLPGIGIGRAVAIVAYREGLRGKNNNSEVFRDCDDLQKVKGIGPKTAEKISEWLKFE